MAFSKIHFSAFLNKAVQHIKMLEVIFCSSHATFLTQQRGVYEISVILRTNRRPASILGRAFLEELPTAIWR